ncbi:L-rhamnonate dehydratase [Streptomyces sp. NPDC004752]
MNADRIVAVRAHLVTRPPQQHEADAPDSQTLRNWRRGKVASPMTVYPEFRDDRGASIGPAADQTVVVEVESASGHVGVAATAGGLAAAAVIELHLAYLVEGEFPMAHERLWDRMFHSTLRYGRKGLVLHAISAVDLALWDLHGQITGLPVYELLGGPVRDAVPLYATGPRADTARKLGFRAAKLPLTWAPCEGEEGFRANVAAAEEARELVGPDFPLMYDCWMSLDVDYAARLAHAVAPLGFAWLEEPLPPDDYDGLRRLRARMPQTMALTTGEHEYTAAGFRLLCEAGVDVIQPDPAWCGGLTELRRIAAVARTTSTRLIPHTGGLYSAHFAMAHREVDMAEFAIMEGECDTAHRQHGDFIGEVLPVDGQIIPGEGPGFGLTIDPEVSLARPSGGWAAFR